MKQDGVFHIICAYLQLRKTFDGIEAGGTRVADEVEALSNQLGALQHISFIGHSLGGIYIRYINVRQGQGYWENEAPLINDNHSQSQVGCTHASR